MEVTQNPLVIRREYGESVLASANFHVIVNDEIERRAHEFVDSGIKPLDALHLASAEEAEADYFCTCDDRFLRLAKTVGVLKMRVVTPLELVEELNI